MSLKRKLYIISTVALIVTVILVLAAAYIRDKMTAEALVVQEEVATSQLIAREAQVSFKKQVQEWKNVLLRGHVVADYQVYLRSFEQEEDVTAQLVRDLIPRLSDNKQALGLALKFLESHTLLGQQYRSALKKYRATVNNKHILTDNEVRGIDRAPTDYLEQVVRLVDDRGRERLSAIQNKLSVAQKFIYILLLSSILVFTWLIYTLTQKLVEEATTDPITGLPNRRELIRELEKHINEKFNAFLVLIDIDQFKLINETCGHSGADDYLRSISKSICKKISPEVNFFHSNGDEFVLIFDKQPEKVVYQLVEDIRSSIENLVFKLNKGEFKTTASIAIVKIDRTYRRIEDIFTAADLTLQEAKESGRNQVVIYNSLNEGIANRQKQMRIVHDVNLALRDNRFALYKQKIDGISEKKSYYEILIRMYTKDGVVVSPSVFLPAIEKYNLAYKIDRWVIINLVEYLVQNPSDTNTYSVNLSGGTLSDPKFIRFLFELIDSYNFNVKQLSFEITETEAVKNIDNARKIIEFIKKHGCEVALDDFGTGVSSFSYLIDFEVDTIKIDGVFIKSLLTNQSHQAVVCSVVEIAKTLNANTVAEFVENDEITQKLKEIGVDYAQGFGIHKPDPLIPMSEKD